MACAAPSHISLFSNETRSAFSQHINENPNNRRVSRSERLHLLELLENPETRPSSQQEFSRRNYVKKTFAWNAARHTLIAVAKDKKVDREVVVDEEIVDVVELVHVNTGHAGWDATWKDVCSSYYGILRADVIFLLKRCPVCVEDPRKRPKSQSRTEPLTDPYPPNPLSIDDLLHFSTFDTTQSADVQGEQS